MKDYKIDINTTVFEDRYDEGEGDCVNSFENSYTLSAESPMLAIEEAFKKMGYSFDSQTAMIDDEEDNQVWYSNLVDVENIEVNEGEKQYDDFKDGKISLYSANHSIRIYEVIPANLTN